MSNTEATGKYDTVANEDELWLVKLPNGAIRSMTIDAMDEAFQAGELDERTPVQAPDADGWSTLGAVAGLDEETPAASAVAPSYEAVVAKTRDEDSRDSIPPSSSNAPSLAPMVASIAPPSSTFAVDGRRAPASASSLDITRPSVADLDAELAIAEAYARAGKKRMAFTMAFVAVGAVVCGAAVSFVSGNATPAPAAAAKAPEVVAPPPAVDPATAFEKPALTEEQKKRLADADKARNAKKGTGSPNGAPLQGTKSGTKEPGSPFHQGGDKFDPLNGSL
jgi:hypothetical protein